MRACSWVPCQDVVAVRSTSERTFMFHFQTPVAQGGPSRCIQARLLWSCLSNLSESHGRPCVWRAIDQPSAAFKASLSWSVSRFRRFRARFDHPVLLGRPYQCRAKVSRFFGTAGTAGMSRLADLAPLAHHRCASSPRPNQTTLSLLSLFLPSRHCAFPSRPIYSACSHYSTSPFPPLVQGG